MHRRFRIAIAAFAIATCQAAAADSPLQKSLQQSIEKAPAVSGEVVIVMRFLRNENADLDTTTAAAARMVALLAKQPGYVDGQFLRNTNPDGEPTFLHVTRWQSFEDWENLFTIPEVSAEMARESGFLSATGSAFVPMNQ